VFASAVPATTIAAFSALFILSSEEIEVITGAAGVLASIITSHNPNSVTVV